ASSRTSCRRTPRNGVWWGRCLQLSRPRLRRRLRRRRRWRRITATACCLRLGGRERGALRGAKKITFPLEHSLGDGKFEQIGTFTGILRTSGVESGNERQVITKLRLARNVMTTAEKQAFENLVKNDGFYTVRIPANLIKPRRKQVLASVKARCLAAANLKERFDLFMEQGNLIGVGYAPIGDCSYPRPQVFPKDYAFETLIVAKGNEQAPRLGPRFEEVVPLRPGEKLVEGEEGIKVVVEKTFWQKYWIYIVPFGFIVINALSQLANLPEEGQPGQGPAINAPSQRTGGSGGGRNRR
ncbi:hypothetical protein M758_4G157700, partial [Ceratodon purpureus]